MPNSHFQFFIIVESLLSSIFRPLPKQIMRHEVSSLNMTVLPHIAHQAKVVTVILLRTSGLCTLLFGLLKQHLGDCQFHRDNEVERGCLWTAVVPKARSLPWL